VVEDHRDNSLRSGLRGYISYSHADLKYVSRLKSHLRIMQTTGDRIDFWADAEITAGDEWYDAVSGAIATADVFIACMSSDYLASEFRYREEWPRITERVRAGALLVPVILRQCAWFGFVDTLQPVPTDKGRLRPILDWRPQEDGYHRAAVQIAEAIHQHFVSPGGRSATPRVPVEVAPAHMVPFAPAENERLSLSDIDQAVKAVIGRRMARSGGD
jgi:hypothetical protein